MSIEQMFERPSSVAWPAMKMQWVEGNTTYEIEPVDNMPGFFRVGELLPGAASIDNEVMLRASVLDWLVQHPDAPPFRW